MEHGRLANEFRANEMTTTISGFPGFITFTATAAPLPELHPASLVDTLSFYTVANVAIFVGSGGLRRSTRVRGGCTPQTRGSPLLKQWERTSPTCTLCTYQVGAIVGLAM